MNRTDKYEGDILRQHIDAGRIEKAPEDFTHRVMTKLRSEVQPPEVKAKFRGRYIVPAISVIFTLVLIIIASSIPGDSGDSVPFITILQDVKFPELNLSFKPLSTLNIPALIPYLITGILFLGFFDLGLYGLFHRERR